MNPHAHLDDVMQTTCLFCGSVFRVTQQQLDQAHGKVRCGVCGEQFNALLTLENYQGEATHRIEAAAEAAGKEENIRDHEEPQPEKPRPDDRLEDASQAEPVAPVSLQAAMYGDAAERRRNRQWLWGLGILGLLALLVVQVIYYLRYDLIAKPEYQQQVLNLCRVLPCDEQRFHSPQQFRLTERNVFTHPTRDQALIINGRFVNQAPFAQQPLRLRISLSDLQGNLIANRLFTPDEYLVDPGLRRIEPGKSVPFRLEIFDPDEKALTYEFDFVS